MKGYRISILRHGKTSANEDGIYIGRTDLPLSEAGKEELRELYETHEYPKVQKVYTSPLERAVQSAEILFPDTELVIAEGMRELDFGEFEGKSVDELVNREDYKAWLGGSRDARPPKGESLEEMTARTFSALHGIITDMMNTGLNHCALITHGGIISNLLTGFGLPKYDPKYLNAPCGEGFDLMITAQMWLNSQAFEILGYYPYNK